LYAEERGKLKEMRNRESKEERWMGDDGGFGFQKWD
jgi:hypothetical protein